MVAAAQVRTCDACFRIGVISMISGVGFCAARVSDAACRGGSRISFDVEDCVGSAWGV